MPAPHSSTPGLWRALLPGACIAHPNAAQRAPNPKTAGLSGGSWVAALTGAGVDPDVQLPAILGGLGSCIGNLPTCGAVARTVLSSLLPDDAPARLNGRLTVAVAQLNAFEPSLRGSATWMISSWTSKEDLLDTMIASASIPCYNLPSNTSAPGIYAILRGQPVRTPAIAAGGGGSWGRGAQQLPACLPALRQTCLRCLLLLLTPAPCAGHRRRLCRHF